MFERIKLFLQESRRELGRVNWPTREETLRLTAVVVAISLGIAVFLGAFDYLFLKGVQAIVSLAPETVEAPIQATTTTDTTATNPIFDLTPDNVESTGGKLNVVNEKPSTTGVPNTF